MRPAGRERGEVKDDEINEAIAMACAVQHRCCRCRNEATIVRYHAFFCGEDCAERAGDFTLDDGQQTLPDYCGDLNAMAEAVKSLRPEVANEWADELTRITSFGANPHWKHWYHLANATARQRAEAFIKAMGLGECDKDSTKTPRHHAT